MDGIRDKVVCSVGLIRARKGVWPGSLEAQRIVATVCDSEHAKEIL